tara:strand:+ start:1909 stop:2715 length:807 start_codon:yes stop_codon:yes gene_type:complete
MINNKIVLFDMDGTLTEPRGLLNTELLLPLRELSRHAEIGVLTGSDYNYIQSQLLKLIKFSEIRFKLHLLPCNGTKHYSPPQYPQEDFTLIHENNMEQELGNPALKEIYKILTKEQAEVCYNDIPLTGHFINYRGSIINWCPIGRNASPEQRAAFVEYDKKNNFRERLINKLQSRFELRCPNKVQVRKGGETSFDIYPNGWDKTYALRHFPDYECWFVGDRCEPGGNDCEIYQELMPWDRSFQTKHTIETAWIIREEILPKFKGKTNG